jgi:hypothetical protein
VHDRGSDQSAQSDREGQGNGSRIDLLTGEGKWLRRAWQELSELANEVELSPWEKRLLKIRWVDETSHYDKLWRRQRRRHDLLGVVTIVAGLTVPLLVAVEAAEWALAVAGFVVAVSSSLEGFFRFGQRWRHQRSTAILLKAEGMRFLELRDPYGRHGSHQAAFPFFLAQLEQINDSQSEEYLALAAQRPAPDPTQK